MMTDVCRGLLVLVWIVGAGAGAWCQTRVAVAERLQKAELDLRQATTELDRAEAAGREGLLPALDLERLRTIRAKALVEFEAALAEASGAENRVLVKSAIKRRDRSGQIRVSVTLECTGLRSLLQSEPALQTHLGQYLQAPVDVFVSLRDDNTVISDPYQVRIASLKAGELRTDEFTLLKDVDMVEVVTAYHALEDKTKVYLLKGEGGAGSLVVTAQQRSLDAELGGVADFAIRVDRFSDTVRKCSLEVAGLPPSVAYEFSTLDGQSRLSEVNFEEGVSAASLRLRIRLPAEMTAAVVVDSPIRFDVSCPAPDPARPADGPARAAGRNDVVRLEVMPRGTGRLDVLAKTLFKEVSVGEDVDFTFTLRNSGTRPVDAVRVQVDQPSGWSKSIEPRGLISLQRNQEVPVRVRLSPTSSGSVGDYEVRIRMEATVFGRVLPVDEKVARISVIRNTNSGVVVGLSSLLALLLAGLVFAGRRLARR